MAILFEQQVLAELELFELFFDFFFFAALEALPDYLLDVLARSR